MSGQNQQPPMNQQYAPQFPPSFQNNDEIDLRELFKALWDGKLIIFAMTIVIALGAAGYAYITPNVYQSKATLMINADPYGFAEDSGYSVGSRIVHESKSSFPVLNSAELKESILDMAEESSLTLAGVALSHDRKSGAVTVSKRSADPEDAWGSVKLYTDHVNAALKAKELQHTEVAIKSSEALLNNQSGKVLESLSVRYANQLYKRAILQNADSVLVKVVSKPLKPTSHVKPKRALIITLGTLLGGMLGVAIVLVRFAFRREED